MVRLNSHKGRLAAPTTIRWDRWGLSGLGVFWGWIAVAWYTPTLLETAGGITVHGNPLCRPACTAVALVLARGLLPAARRRGARLTRPSCVSAAGALACLATLAAALVLRQEAIPAYQRWLCAVALGLPSALIMTAWGALCCSLKTDAAEKDVPLSFLAAPACVGACVLLPRPVSVAVMALLPVASCALYVRAYRAIDVGHGNNAVAEGPSLTSAQQSLLTRRVLRVALTAAGLETLVSTLLSLAPSGLVGMQQAYAAFILGMVAGSALVACFIRYAAHPDIDTAFRLLPCLAAVGVLLYAGDGAWGATGGAAVVSVVQLALDIMMLIALSRIGSMGWATPFTVGVLSRLPLQVGVVLGNDLGTALAPLVSQPLASCVVVAAFGLACAVVAASATVYDRPRFLALVDAFENGGTSRGDAGGEGPAVPMETRCAQLARRCGLTPREHAVLCLLARGMSAPFISDQMSISRNTVDTHIKNIYRKAAVHSRDELITAVYAEPLPPDPLDELM